MAEAAMEIQRGDVALAGQHERTASNGYEPIKRLPQMIASSMSSGGDLVEIILDCDFETPQPTPENPDPEPERRGILELRFFQRDAEGEDLPPVRVRLSTDLLPSLAAGLAEAKRTAASRFDFLDNLHANR